MCAYIHMCVYRNRKSKKVRQSKCSKMLTLNKLGILWTILATSL